MNAALVFTLFHYSLETSQDHLFYEVVWEIHLRQKQLIISKSFFAPYILFPNSLLHYLTCLTSGCVLKYWMQGEVLWHISLALLHVIGVLCLQKLGVFPVPFDLELFSVAYIEAVRTAGDCNNTIGVCMDGINRKDLLALYRIKLSFLNPL